LIRNRAPTGAETDGDPAGEAAGEDDGDEGDTDGAEDGADASGDDLAQPARAMRATATITAIRLSTGSR